MRLTCPNCTAEYDIADGMVPPAGRHVQCTACHTRWFVRGVPGTGLTEEQILRRLETWSPGARTAIERPAAPVAPVPSPAPAAAEPAPAPAAPPPAAAESPRNDPPVVVHLPPRTPALAKPADRPAVAQPGQLLTAARPATRLDLGEPAAPPPAAEAPLASRSRFGRGLVVALVLTGIALSAYIYRDFIVARVPAAGPALQAYSETIDRWRDELEVRIAPFRPAQGTGTAG